jgi:hypothetical protein
VGRIAAGLALLIPGVVLILFAIASELIYSECHRHLLTSVLERGRGLDGNVADKREASPGTIQTAPTAQGRQPHEAAGHAVVSGDANPTSRVRFPHLRARRAGPFRG